MRRDVLFVFLALSLAAPVQADPLPNFKAIQGCTEITKQVGIKNSGRFGWKPLAAHFSAFTVITPRLYSLPRTSVHDAPTVEVYTHSGLRLFGGHLFMKSWSSCNGVGEDLCAGAYIPPNGWTGARVERKYSTDLPLIVKVDVSAQVKHRYPNRYCRVYQVPHPKDRVQYANQ